MSKMCKLCDVLVLVFIELRIISRNGKTRIYGCKPNHRGVFHQTQTQFRYKIYVTSALIER